MLLDDITNFNHTTPSQTYSELRINFVCIVMQIQI